MTRRLWLLVAFVVAGAAVLPVPHFPGPRRAQAEEVSTEELVDQLGSKDSKARSRAYVQLRGRDDPKTVALIVDRVPAQSLTSQYYGILVLDTYSDKQLKRVLRKLLSCESAYMRLCAAEMLHRRGATRMPSVIAKELFQEGLDPAHWTKMMTRLRAGRLPADKKLVAALAAPLVVGSDMDRIRETAYVLHDAGADAAAPTFKSLLEDPRPGVRAIAAAFLRSREPARDADLAGALRTGDVPSSVIGFLRNVLTDPKAPPAEQEIPDALIEATRTAKRPLDVRAVIPLLTRLAGQRALPRLRELIDHESSLVSQAAAAAVEKLSGTAPSAGSSPASTDSADTVELTKMLKKRDREGLAKWLTDKKATRRLAAADGLRRMDDGRGFDVVLAEVTGKNPAHRRHAVKTLGNFRTDRAVEPLVDATLDTDGTVRMYAWTALNSTLRSLFPQRQFDLTARAEWGDAPESRKERADQVRTWWAAAKNAPW